MSVVLEVTDLQKEYLSRSEVVRALNGLSLEVNAGEFLAVMGASGSGKSTLLHLIGGLDTPTRGRILIEGNDLARMGDRERTLFRRRRLGMVFQAFNLLPTLTAAENVALPLLIDQRPNGDVDSKAESLLEAVDVAHRLSHRPQALSGGEQQRVAIARALVNDPAIVLADEPTGNLDKRHSTEIWQLLAKLSTEQDRTVIAVTHDASGAAYADRVLVLTDGRLVGEFQPEPRGDATLVATRYAELAG